ncbi:hypothetical protein ON010_g16001 [Phytophthora cinnamomi]|nr:hypothetical protein ON010_g16001 [Phytophthora cinnamomi]
MLHLQYTSVHAVKRLSLLFDLEVKLSVRHSATNAYVGIWTRVQPRYPAASAALQIDRGIAQLVVVVGMELVECCDCGEGLLGPVTASTALSTWDTTALKVLSVLLASSLAARLTACSASLIFFSPASLAALLTRAPWSSART